ncbi:hypothetical protein KR009_005010 [Drosophila setifemur]|nr:hypothetical protein KR009_005010 [Drosophila setifemur]
MMSQLGNFAYLSNVPNLDGYVLELPYGTQDTLAMVVVLPKKGTKLNNVVYNLKTIGLEPILQSLSYNKRQDNFNDNEIDVLMPKFITKTDFSLKGILGKMGITDLFDEDRANLTRMGTNLFAKLCIHSTKIIVDEKGRLTQVGLTNSRKPPTFEMNRPFLYMIVEKTSNLMLFAGQVRNPIANQ